MTSKLSASGFKQKAAGTMRSIWRHKASYAFMVPFITVFCVFTLIPVLIAVFYSFTQFNVLEPAKWIGLDNYKNLFLKDFIFLSAIKNTVLFSAITGPVSYIMCLLLAWFLNDFAPKGRAFLTLLFYAPTLANVFYVWQLIFSGDSNGFVNSYLLKLGVISSPVQWLTDTETLVPVLIFILLWSSLGTSFLVLIAGFQNVDKTLYESGAVDGIRNRWQELWFITLPYMKPQLMFAAVMNITASFGIGPTIDILCGNPSTDYKAWTIMNHLNDYGGVRFEMGYACAIATVLFFLMVGSNKLIQKILEKVGD